VGRTPVDYLTGWTYARGSNFAANRRIMEIRVEGSLDQAMRALKRKLAKEGVFKEMKKRAFYEKPSVRRKRKRSEAQRRRRKEQRRRRASAM
jgi:small subunit ribosomal protein S21